MSEDRTKVAMDMAARAGADWETMDQVIRNAYLHNADVDIQTRAAMPVEKGGTAVSFTCKVCGDQAYIGGKPCVECNPVGLPAEQVHPGAVKEETAVAIGHVNLCDFCSLALPSCDSVGVEFGDGEGNDNVIKCDTYSPTKSDEPTPEEIAAKVAKEADLENRKATGELGPNEYRCGKCSKPGRTVIHILQKSGKGIGHKHQEFKIVSPAGA